MANERTEPLQLNLGSLRSAMSLTLHTHHASRIWHGRAATEGRPGIVGLNGYIAVMNKMKRGAEQDDPYSDWWMLRIEEKLDHTKATLQSLREQVDQALAGVPAALSLGEKQLYVGIEYDYWKDKYGIKDTDAFDTDQNTASLLVKVHF